MKRYHRFVVLLLAVLFLPLSCPQPGQSAPAKAAIAQGGIKKQKAALAISDKAAPAKKKAAVSKSPVQSASKAKAGLKKTAGKLKKPEKTQKSATGPQTVKKASQQGLGRNTAARQRATRAASLPPRQPEQRQIRQDVSPSPNIISCQVSARSAMILDARTGGSLFEKDPDIPRQPASTIKIVTALIAINTLKKHDIVPVSHKAANMPSSKINLDPAQYYLADDLINAVLLASANDASVALAERIAGSEEQFARIMTRSALLWGAKHTVCRTASGLTAEGQQTTARDLAGLFRNAMRDEEFARRINQKTEITSYGKTLKNHNKALWRVKGADGGKTGYTDAARQTYVGQFTREGRTIIVAIMGSETMWADLNKLVEYGFRQEGHRQLARMRHTETGENTF